MVLDYSEKRGARETRESIERKPVQKNRPRKEPFGMFALLSAVVLLFTFGAGVLTGWVLFKGAAIAPAAVAQPAKKEPAPASGQPNPAGTDVPLTFYRTLPAGGRGMIGSGFNLNRPMPVLSAPQPAPFAAPAHTPAFVPTPALAPVTEAKQEARTRFVVQIASYRDRKEADNAQAKLAGKGVAAYVLESKLPDKGVWYRLRVGRHLIRSEAEELAGNAGKGAVVLPE